MKFRKQFWIYLFLFTATAVVMILWGWEFLLKWLFSVDPHNVLLSSKSLTDIGCDNAPVACDPLSRPVFSWIKFWFSFLIHELVIVPFLVIHEQSKNVWNSVLSLLKYYFGWALLLSMAGLIVWFIAISLKYFEYRVSNLAENLFVIGGLVCLCVLYNIRYFMTFDPFWFVPNITK